MRFLDADITIVGCGIAGLWCGKQLIDQGFSVQLFERADALAHGATTRNEGLLLAGAYHAAVIADEEEASTVVRDVQQGHEATIRFAPESIEPDSKFFALSSDRQSIDHAIERWQRFNIAYRPVLPRVVIKDGLNPQRVAAAFEVQDKGINTRILCAKLAQYITDHGGRIVTSATFKPIDSEKAAVTVGDDTYVCRSARFVMTAGSGIKPLVETVTNKPFPMRYFKSHLLVVPSMTEYSYITIDAHQATITRHGAVSVIGYTKDVIEVTDPDCHVIPKKAQEVYNALCRLLPEMQRRVIQVPVLKVACIKTDVSSQLTPSSTMAQRLDMTVCEPATNYICAVPGKMTAA